MNRKCMLAVLLILTPHLYVCAGRHVAAPSRPAGFAEKIDIPGISDAGKVSEFLYRGAQPNRQGMEQLKAMGIDTIVDLRGERRHEIEEERVQAQSLGMRLVNIPGSGWSPPRDEQIAQFLMLIREEPRRQVVSTGRCNTR